MLRIRNLRCQILSSWIGNPLITSSGLSNSIERNFSHPALFLLINGSNLVPRSIYHVYIANKTEQFSTLAGTILVQARDPAKLSLDIQLAIDEHRHDDAWRFLEQHMEMEGFPRKSVVNKLIVGYAETLDSKLLNRVFGLVEKAFEEGKQDLFEKENLIYLALALARCSQPVPASVILRKLIRMGEYPPVSAWSAILAYMSQSSSGAFLSAKLILEIGYRFQDNRIDPRKKSNAPLIAMKPNALAIGVTVAGCLVSGTTRIAEQLLDMMPRICVKTDSTLLVLMAHVYERNGRREELKKLKRYIDEAHDLDDFQFRQYYNCLLNCHLMFGDLDSASQMVLEMLRKAKEANNSLAAATLRFEPAEKRNSSSIKVPNTMELCTSGKGGNQPSSFMSFEEFCSDREFSCLEGELKKILMSLSQQLQMQVELIITERGVLRPTEKTYVKLAKTYLKSGKTKDLAEFLIKVEKENSPFSVEDSALVDVINSCISLGWLDQAHDLLDELRYAGIKTSSSVYSSLLKAYCKEKRMREVTSLLREVRKAGIQLDASCYETLIESRVLQEDTQGALHLFKEMKEAKIPRVGRQEYKVLAGSCSKSGEAGFMAKLLQEIKEGEMVDCGVPDWNNVIHFFCKKRLMKDAENALKKMRSLGHTPNAQTFHSLVTGYAAIGGKYIEVTELWGEMKSLAADAPMKFDQELLDSVLYTFVRGGFFVRANEVVEMMEKGNMFIDKYRYRNLFLKYHKTLYKGKAPNYQSEAQLKKRDAALAFKKWIGLF